MDAHGNYVNTLQRLSVVYNGELWLCTAEATIYWQPSVKRTVLAVVR